ncbi:hypothetical protein GLOIN_2v1593312 [Rhizophagus clarus]|uniref:Crinkler effector protein N-terminal domain-containing protein n=1 Tax=Rhizophagus clarus TaxID=94130 RepID=A0A8H3L928_9GLOM|nr:hypothetical protein GLOIN_2v1593312 [Rhizophagus clarus]
MEMSFNFHVLLGDDSETQMFKVAHLRDYICYKKRVFEKNKLRLWRVNVDEGMIKNENISTEDDIMLKLGGKEMKHHDLFSKFFKDELADRTRIIQVPSSEKLYKVNWTNVNSIYKWIITLKRLTDTAVPKLVSTIGANFPLQDRNNHPIPLLANGPGTGKSRFLQEVPTLLRERAEKLLREQAKEHTNNNELLSIIKDKMCTINVTFGNGTPAQVDDVSIGQSSVALRILYEHFISSGDCCYEDFVILGIDELNVLHSKRVNDHNPVRDIVHADGGLNCSSGNIFYVPILAGTIQGPLEAIFKESTYIYLPLPLRLLHDQEVQNISEFVVSSECNHNVVDYTNSGTFRRCISDFGGQVRALEIFYNVLLKKLKRGTNNVDYIHCMSQVKEALIDRYKFDQFTNNITPAIAHAILNIPVSKVSKADISKKVTYIDLSSEGILNLEKADSASYYVCMPYIWIVILTSYNASCQFWEIMIRQDSHVFWESFEFFNVKFWTLRLTLLSILNNGKNVTIKDLFRGTYDLCGFEFLEREESGFKLIDESSIKYKELKHRYPNTSQDEHLSPCTVYKNCKGAPFDLFFFIDNYFFAIQVKSSDATTNRPQTLSKKMINDEYNKTEKAYKELKEKIPELKDWMLFICTNGPKTEDALDLLHSNCLVIYKANFKDFYGYTCSSRAEFSEANDKLDVNTASEYELRTIEKIEEKTAREICNKKLYNDDNDLFSKVSMNEQTKERVKITKKN